jgi:uncharacterized membrane protein
LVPVVVGIATGDQLSWIVYLGVAAALPGIWLVSTAATSSDSTPADARTIRAAGLRDGAAAGLGFAFLMSTQHGYLAVAAIMASLYPAGTVLLATAILRERIQMLQAIGLGLCGVAVACVAAG